MGGLLAILAQKEALRTNRQKIDVPFFGKVVQKSKFCISGMFS